MGWSFESPKGVEIPSAYSVVFAVMEGLKIRREERASLRVGKKGDVRSEVFSRCRKLCAIALLEFGHDAPEVVKELNMSSLTLYKYTRV